MKNNNKIRNSIRLLSTAAALGSLLALAACASNDAPADAAASAPPAAETNTAAAPSAASAFDSGAPAPRFIVPPAADQSPPSVNTVPTEAPTPPSTAAEREEVRRGLIADLANARHSEQGGRMQPVVVRPYVASAEAPPAAAELPPAPDASLIDAPPPERPPEASNPAKPAAGPAPAYRVPTGN